MKPKLLLFSFIGLTLIVSLTIPAALVFFYYNSGPKPLRAYIEKEEEEEDEMLLAQMHEYRMTYDPSLNLIPRQRLLVAEKEAERIITANKSSRLSSLAWTERGPNNIGGRTRAILVDANDATGNTVWAGSVGGGLWKTTNFKSSPPAWTKVNDFMSNLAISCIVQDQNNPNVIYFGTGEGWSNIDAIQGAGIWKSSDGGVSWSQLSATSGLAYIQDMVIDDYGNVYATTRATTASMRGVIRSTDGGTSWAQVLSDGNTITRGADLKLASNGDIYATLGIFNSGSIWVSSKATYGSSIGASGNWANITPSGTWQRIEVALAPSNSSRIYALLQGTGSGIGGIRTSSDGGANWTTIANPTWCDNGSNKTDFTRSQAWYDLSIVVDPSDENTVYIGGVDVLKTTDGGTNWSQVTQWASGCSGPSYVHADIHAIQFIGNTGSDIIVGSDGGIFYSTDSAASFSNRNSGYNVTQYYAVAISGTAGSDTMLAGAQDNGSHRFTSSGINTVASVTGGDGAYCFIDQTAPSVWITSYVYNTYYLFRNSGATFVGATGNSKGRFINPAAYDNSANILYFGDADGSYGRLFNAESGSAGWDEPSVSAAMGTNRQVSCIRVDPNNAGTIWLGCSDSENNTGAAVTPSLVKVTQSDGDITGPPGGKPIATAYAGPTLPAGAYISNIDMETGNSNHMILTVSNYGVTSVWESIDGGTSWTSVEGNLPDMPIRWALFVPAGYTPSGRTSSIGGVLLATELGVWSTTALNGGATNWVPNNTGLANVRTDMLVLRDADKTFAAATHGRGVFTSSLALVLPVGILSFEATAQQDQNELAWATENDFFNQGFDVERKYNGQSRFEKIGFVESKNSATGSNRYNFTDTNIDPGVDQTFYRLKQYDEDGQYTYSKVVSVTRTPKFKFINSVVVNGNNLLIDAGNFRNLKAMDVLITDMSGRVVLRTSGEYQDRIINLGTIAKGIYVVDIFSGKDTRFTKKIVR